MNSPIIIGLDTDTVPVRLIYATIKTQNNGVPYVVESRSFKTANGFRKYWRRFCSPAPYLVVSVPDQTPDPLELIPWLKGQNAILARFGWFGWGPHLKGDFEIWGLSSVFERSFSLALNASYRLEGTRVVQHLWTQAAIAHGMLKQIRDGLHRLSAALPGCDFPADDYEPEELQLELPF